MYRTRFLCLAAALCCAAGLAVPAQATEVDCDQVYCFSAEDFSGETAISGICITELPENAGVLRLGSRILMEGDILTAGQVGQMTFTPVRSQRDAVVQVGYLPIYDSLVAENATMTLSIRGREDKAPVAEDFAMETYKNLANTGKLKVTDPEGQAMTYTVTRIPKRGEVVIREDGSFIYTPKKNKVGVDSFTYTATDPAGNVSREATVTITVVKPSDATQYTDTAGKSCRFAAEWMKNTGIFVGENVNGNGCFQPEKEVSRGDFLTMLVGALEIPLEEEAAFTGFTDEAPEWLRPYLAAALRSGLTAGWPEGNEFRASQPITGAEAAVMLQNALDLAAETVVADEAVPVWAQQAVSTLSGYGIQLSASEPLNRGQAAEIMYRVSQLKKEAPGMTVLRAAQ